MLIMGNRKEKPKNLPNYTHEEDDLSSIKNVRDIETFVLRRWQEKSNGNAQRFALVHTRTGAKRGFASLEELVQFLQGL